MWALQSLCSRVLADAVDLAPSFFLLSVSLRLDDASWLGFFLELFPVWSWELDAFQCTGVRDAAETSHGAENLYRHEFSGS